MTARDPVPLSLAKRKVRAGRDEETTDDTIPDGPFTAMGVNGLVVLFLTSSGQLVDLPARHLGLPSVQSMLAGGDTSWFITNFPRRRTKTTKIAGETVVSDEVDGWQADAVRDYLFRQAKKAGIFEDDVQVRKSGIWKDEIGAPLIHAGDEIIFADGTVRAAGFRTGREIWAACARTPRPGPPCGVDVARDLQSSLQRLWSFRQPGGAILLLGLMGTGYLGLAAPWRPNIFVIGEPGSGKSLLIDTVAAAIPMHYYSNNTTEAGVQGAVNGHPQPIFLDESSDRQNGGGGESLMDMAVASTSGDGTRGGRGKADGGYRTIEMAGVVLYGSVTPPPLQPQHLARITPIDLLRPGAGEDNRVEMEALIEAARGFGPALWGRALAGWRRWRAAFEGFRARLGEVGCAPREMDQMGALLSGWWILVEDGVPDSRRAAEGVAAIADSIRKADDVADESGPARALRRLLSSRVQYDGSTRQDQIGALLAEVFEGWHESDTNSPYSARTAARALEAAGIRVILPCQRAWRWEVPAGWVRDPSMSPKLVPCDCANCMDSRKRHIPRRSDSGGVWLNPDPLARFFYGERGLEGRRWVIEILRLESAERAKITVSVSKVVGKHIWVSREAFGNNGLTI